MCFTATFKKASCRTPGLMIALTLIITFSEIPTVFISMYVCT